MKGPLPCIGVLAWTLPSLSQDTGWKTGGPFTSTANVKNQCVDNKGQHIPEGLLFTPGPDECKVCTCMRQLPILCRTVLCAPPTGCRTLMAGESCCEWVCNSWDTPTSQKPVSDLGLRLVASGVTAILSLSLLFFLIYRLRQRKLRGRQNHLEAESLNSVNGRGEDSSPPEGFPDQGFPLAWFKPPTRPFPPSYNEAMSGEIPPPLPRDDISDSSSDHSTAPPYNSIHLDPVISYPVATLGRLVLPAPGTNFPPEHLHCHPPSHYASPANNIDRHTEPRHQRTQSHPLENSHIQNYNGECLNHPLGNHHPADSYPENSHGEGTNIDSHPPENSTDDPSRIRTVTTTLSGVTRRGRRERDGGLLHGEERDAALQRFSLQLNLNVSSASSSSSGLTLSPNRRAFTPTSQSSSDSEPDDNAQTRV